MIFVISILLPQGFNNFPMVPGCLFLICVLLIIGCFYTNGWPASLLLYSAIYCLALICLNRQEQNLVCADRIIKILNHYPGRSKLLIKKSNRTKKGCRLECRILSIDTIKLSHLNMSCLLYTPSFKRELNKYDTLSIQIPFRNIRKLANPLSFDKRAFYGAKGIFYEGYISETDDIKHKNFYPSLSDPIASIRYRIAKSINDLNIQKKSKALIHALILGNKYHMHSSTIEKFVNTGCIHVLAVSGLHTGIIFSLFCPLLYLMRFWHSMRWLNIGIISALLFIFVAICGFPSSAVRAALMLGVWLLTKCLGILHNSFSILALTAFAVLMMQPSQIHQLGFKLSYLALAGIIVLYNKIPFNENKILRSIWASPLRMVWLSISAQFFITPILLLELKSFAPYFAISSMIAVPFIFIIMLFSIVAILSHNFIPLVNASIDTLIATLTQAIASIETWPSSTIKEIYFTDVAFAVSSLFLLLFAVSLILKNKLSLIYALCILISIIPCLQAQRLYNLHTVAFSVFHQYQGSLITIHHHGMEDIIYQSGKSNPAYLLSKLRNAHSIHCKNHNTTQLPVTIKSGKFSLLITGPEHIICCSKKNSTYADILLLTQANKSVFLELIDRMKFKLVIIDGSTTYDNKTSIIEILNQYRIPYHDTSTQGFWNYKLLNI